MKQSVFTPSNQIVLARYVRNGSSVSKWRYVKSEDNPADDASNGLRLDAMLKDNGWLKGPEFLGKDESTWPTSIEVPPLNDDNPEIRKETMIYATAVSKMTLENLLQRYSSWWRLKRAISWLSRYKHLLKTRVKVCRKGENSSELRTDISEMKFGNLGVDELRRVESDIVRYVQSTSFPELTRILAETGSESRMKSEKKSLQKAGASLYKLNTKMNERVVVVGGRLKNAQINDEAKHPMILSYKHHVTNLIIKHHHVAVGHMGQESVLASLRERFWILKGRSVVRCVVRTCVDCQKRKKPASVQFMADLPQDRITAYSV